MFIVNKDGNSVIEAKQVDMRLEYDEETKKEADDIYNKIMIKAYNYGSTENAMKEASARIREFLFTKKKICRILVNGKIYFEDYDEKGGKIIFDKILTALRNGDRFFDMREVEFGEDKE